MLRRVITVVFVPHNRGASKSLRISVPVVWLTLALLVGFCITLVLFLLDYRHKRAELAEFENLHRIVRERDVEINSLKERLALLKGNFQRLIKFDVELKAVANLDKSDDGTGGGVGGPVDVGRPITSITSRQRSDELIDKIRSEVEQMRMEVAIRQESFKDLNEYLDKQSYRRAATPSIWPARGTITSPFGVRNDPFREGRMERHTGIDISSRRGEPVRATADGVVKYAGWKDGYGKAVYIDHGYGYETRYAHNDRIVVNKWQKVKRGDIIAYVGSTGRSTGSHLHYEVLINSGRDYEPVNPYFFLLD